MSFTVDGSFLQVAAVMGPSGAGKTTFLNALMGTVKYGTISGQVWVNGRAMKMSRLRRIMGFVPQVLPIHSPKHACMYLSKFWVLSKTWACAALAASMSEVLL